jgi:formamidopyrimidine-DNA glycosylase
VPELPEVETMRRGILGIIGSRITDVARADCRRRAIPIEPRIDRFRRLAVDATVTDVGRIGKRVVVHLDCSTAIVFEPRMTGLVLLAEPPTAEHLRLRITLAGGPHKELLFWDRRGLGSVRLFSTAELAERFGCDTVGPDALAITAAELESNLGASRRPIKVALLDQRAVAGIGNLYAAEILHRSAIHPARPCNRLRPDDWRRLDGAIQTVLVEAIRHEGSTLSDGTYRNALNQSGDYQQHHCVYDREGKPCVICGNGIIQRIVQAQRATFFCPQCQPRRAKRRPPLADVRGSGSQANRRIQPRTCHRF